MAEIMKVIMILIEQMISKTREDINKNLEELLEKREFQTMKHGKELESVKQF